MRGIEARAGARIRTIMGRFTSVEAVVERETVNAYGEPTGTFTRIGTADVWINALSKPDKYHVRDDGQIYDDSSYVWVALLAPGPGAKHGDRVTVGGRQYILRNIKHDSVSCRVFWQLEMMPA